MSPRDIAITMQGLPTQPPLAPRPSPLAAAAVGVLALALAVCYLVFHVRTHDLENLRNATEGLLRGQTHWITFQNRILAPAAIDLLRACTGWSWMRGFYFVLFVCTLLGNLALAWLSWKRAKSLVGVAGFVLGWHLLAFLFNHGWSYPWDFVGAALHAWLALWLFECFENLRALLSWRPLLLLVALALNRESSLIALAALLGTVLLVGLDTLAWRSTARAAAALLAALVANVALIASLRAALFVRSTKPPGIGPASELASGNFLQLGENFTLFATPAAGLCTRLEALALAGAVATIVAAYWMRLRADHRSAGAWHPGRLALGLYLLFACGALFAFADLREYRVYFELIPLFLVAGHYALSDPASAASSRHSAAPSPTPSP